MGSLLDALTEVSSDKKAKGKADKKYVSFNLVEWGVIEAKMGKQVDPVDIKKLVMAIVEGKFSISSTKK